MSGGSNMFLWEYIIKLLMGNSNSLFIGLIIVIIGYYGWLLYNINNNFSSIMFKWEKINKNLDSIIENVNLIEKMFYSEISQKLSDNKNDINNIKSEDIQTMKKLVDKMNIAIKYNEFEEYFELQTKFHEVYIKKCDNKKLKELLKSLKMF
jgi:hypothetical protein